MTSIRTEAPEHDPHLIRRELNKRNESHAAKLRKYRAANTLAVMMVGVCGMAIAVAVVEADRVLKREAVINQENVVAWKR